MSRGIHSLPVRGATNDWITPQHVIHSLGSFALDPCCPYYMPWTTAAKYFTDFEDGLWQPWKGRVWLNPPYGDALRHWLSKLAQHGNGIALVPARTEVESWFWPYVWESADAVLFLRGRLYFHRPSGSTAGNAGHGSVLAAYGKRNSDILRRCSLPGRFFTLKS